MDQCGAADGLLHAELAAFHAAGQIDLSFAGEQWNRTHFAQVHAYRIIGIDGFLGWVRSRKLFAIMHFLGVKEICFLIERKPKRLVTLAEKLIFEMIQALTSPISQCVPEVCARIPSRCSSAVPRLQF